MKKLRPGDIVKLTGQFLRSTGQQTGSEGASRWTVIEHASCRSCKTGVVVAVNEPSYDDPSRPRHIASANLYRVGTLDIRNT